MFINLGLIGQPLKHSYSPFIQTRFLEIQVSTADTAVLKQMAVRR